MRLGVDATLPIKTALQGSVKWELEDPWGQHLRKKFCYFRLLPNLAQRKLIDLANHRPSFMPYKAVVLALEFLKWEWNGVQKWNFARSIYSYLRGYSDDPRPRKWHWRFVKWWRKRSWSAAIRYGSEWEVSALLKFDETRFACAQREKCCLQRAGICCLDRPSRDRDLYSSWNLLVRLDLLGQRYTFFIFRRLLDGMRQSRGDTNFACFS